MATEADGDRAYFLDTDIFGTLGTFTAPSLGAVSGLFDAETVSVGLDADVEILAPQPTFSCRTSDLTGVSSGSAVTINSTDYVVRNRYRDGAGMSRLELRIETATTFYFKRPDGTSVFFRPDGTSQYIRN